MDKLRKVKEAASDRSKVNAFLDMIGENDVECRNEVLSICGANKDARKYYIERYEEEMQKMRS